MLIKTAEILMDINEEKFLDFETCLRMNRERINIFQ